MCPCRVSDRKVRDVYLRGRLASVAVVGARASVRTRVSTGTSSRILFFFNFLVSVLLKCGVLYPLSHYRYSENLSKHMTAAVLKDIPVNFAKLDSQTEKEDMGPSFCLDVPSALLPFFFGELRNAHSSVHHTRRLTLAVPYLLLVNPNSTKTERGHTRVLLGER